MITSTVNASQASYAVDSGLSPATSAGAGAVSSTLLTVSAVALYRRRRRKALRGILRSAREQSRSMGTKQAIDTALERLGGNSSGDKDAVEPDTTDDTEDTLALDFDD